MMEKREEIRIDILQHKVEEFHNFWSSLKTEKEYNIKVFKGRLKEIFKLSKYKGDLFEHYFIKEGMWRARSNSDGQLFINTMDFWPPNWLEIPKDRWNFDRFNGKGESMWYCTTSLKASIAEIKPKKGALISVANIKQYATPRLFTFLYIDKTTLKKSDPVLFQSVNMADNRRTEKLLPIEIKALGIVDKLLNDISTKKVSSEERYRYIPSIAIKELFEPAGYDGIIYPSIAYGQQSVNLVIFPRAIENNFFVDQIIAYKVIEAELDEFYEVVPLYVGNINGKNHFENYPIEWQLPTIEEINAYSYNIEIKSSL